MKRPTARSGNRIAWSLAAFAVLDCGIKTFLTARFYRRAAPQEPRRWPAVTLIQPITRGVRDLDANVQARMRLSYPGPLQHVLVCDASDTASLATCREIAGRFPDQAIDVITVGTKHGGIAVKTRKLQAALPQALGEVLGFIDDDVIPEPDMLRRFVAYLGDADVGAVFGLPWYGSSRTVWSALMSGFFNIHIPPVFATMHALAGPFRTIGSVAVYRRHTFAAVKYLDGLERYIDDDFALTQRLRRHGTKIMQAPVRYRVSNDIVTPWDYLRLMKRWFTLGRTMMPALTARQQCVVYATTLPQLLVPALLAAIALASRRRGPMAASGAGLLAVAIAHSVLESHHAAGRMPLRWWLLMPLAATLPSILAVADFLGPAEIQWRGRAIKITERPG